MTRAARWPALAPDRRPERLYTTCARHDELAWAGRCGKLLPMYSILLGLFVSIATFAGVISVFDKWSAIFLAPIAGFLTYFLLARRYRGRIEAVQKDVEGHLKGQRPEKAIQSLESLRPLYRWQPLLGASIEGQIGMLKYAYQRDFEGARPFLEKAHPWFWHPRAMLAAGHYKKGRYDDMEKVFEQTLKRNKKEPLLWAAFAWCQWKRNQGDKALEILARARAVVPNDERIKNQLTNLQNDKKMKMNAFGAEWIALHLEPPPPGAVTPQNARRPGYTPPPHAFGKGVRRMRPS